MAAFRVGYAFSKVPTTQRHCGTATIAMTTKAIASGSMIEPLLLTDEVLNGLRV
jgi:hypothetical protein